jgi:hypothetical protein
MTPKEKAEELLDNILETMFDLRDGYNSGEVFKVAKQCALIAVDEMTKHIEYSYYNDSLIKGAIMYWEEVKQEIERL